ncbi:lipopolysaccharide-induced tumor necrosis factor-alpha factor-like isoform X2 [Daktulosphaira vitifoliae]|uniref:lipopolysaccharide-induced tumor necrosis factor-alpha factor-like isoform X2 n=1 Tax=Daktulosphaira vitifoliae TaxID=58002 RepID=UPI0021AA4B55|nr:lipopolysaccharide-induced tumor necrosis factor-alpha factor-like isoform X2 [Daktulosphaira vitifoliae]
MNTLFNNPEPAVGPDPFHIVCPNCRSDVYSRVERDTAATGYICCGLLFIVGCFCCSCIPLFMDSFQRVDHFCPSCGHFFGTYKP